MGLFPIKSCILENAPLLPFSYNTIASGQNIWTLLSCLQIFWDHLNRHKCSSEISKYLSWHQHVEGCEPNIWDELNLMQKGLSKTWSVGLCFFLKQIFLANIWWRHFSLNLWAVLNLNFRGLFPFPSKCWASGWLVGPRVNYCGMKVTTELLTGESIQCRSSHHVDTFTFQYLSGHYGFGD